MLVIQLPFHFRPKVSCESAIEYGFESSSIKIASVFLFDLQEDKVQE